MKCFFSAQRGHSGFQKKPKPDMALPAYKSVFAVPFSYNPCQSMNTDRSFQYLFVRTMLGERGHQCR